LNRHGGSTDSSLFASFKEEALFAAGYERLTQEVLNVMQYWLVDQLKGRCPTENERVALMDQTGMTAKELVCPVLFKNGPSKSSVRKDRGKSREDVDDGEAEGGDGEDGSDVQLSQGSWRSSRGEGKPRVKYGEDSGDEVREEDEDGSGDDDDGGAGGASGLVGSLASGASSDHCALDAVASTKCVGCGDIGKSGYECGYCGRRRTRGKHKPSDGEVEAAKKYRLTSSSSDGHQGSQKQARGSTPMRDVGVGGRSPQNGKPPLVKGSGQFKMAGQTVCMCMLILVVCPNDC
jgi:hypothetical protein